MQRTSNHWLNLARGALAALLLFAQAAALAHDVDHGPGVESELCATCSIGGNLQHTATAQHEAPVEPGLRAAENHALQTQTAPGHLHHACARGPPIHA